MKKNPRSFVEIRTSRLCIATASSQLRCAKVRHSNISAWGYGINDFDVHYFYERNHVHPQLARRPKRIRATVGSFASARRFRAHGGAVMPRAVGIRCSATSHVPEAETYGQRLPSRPEGGRWPEPKERLRRRRRPDGAELESMRMLAAGELRATGER